MNTLAFHPEMPPSQLLDFVDFKWLMASIGYRVDVERMQADVHYAGYCLGLALGSRSAMLRRLAQRLQHKCDE